MKSDYNNNEALWMTFPRALRYTALAGIILGFSDIWFACNYIWLRWPGASWLVLMATAVFLFMTWVMMFSGHKAIPAILMWLGMGDMVLAHTIMTLLWPGGALLSAYGGLCIIPIIAAIWYYHTAPKQYIWSKKALCWWVIVTQVVFIILFGVRYYYFNYAVDQFEPAIPYAENSVYYLQLRIWFRKYIVMGNGLTMLLSSVYLYHVARQNSK